MRDRERLKEQRRLKAWKQQNNTPALNDLAARTDQGYRYAKPMPLPEFEELARRAITA